jgi:transposase InsO family protein
MLAMTWKTSKPMDLKLQFIHDSQKPGAQMSALCQVYGISRKTGYATIRRYLEEGEDGLEERSRCPHTNPHAWSEEDREAILDCRRQESWGGRKWHRVLRRRHPDRKLPSKSTMDRWFDEAGLVRRRRRRRDRAQGTPHEAIDGPNQTWCADFKGEYKLRNGRYCYPLTITDGFSRYLLGCQALASVETTGALSVFENVFREYGLPQRIRTDNGAPFASTGIAQLSRLSVWWLKLGIAIERIVPGHPEQNGRHERMHRSLKWDLANDPAYDWSREQRRLDHFQTTYNSIRPHEALNDNTPADEYRSSTRAYPKRLESFEYPGYYETRCVGSNGCVKWRAKDLTVGHALCTERVGFQPYDDGLWRVYLGSLNIGILDERQNCIHGYGRGCKTPHRRRLP